MKERHVMGIYGHEEDASMWQLFTIILNIKAMNVYSQKTTHISGPALPPDEFKLTILIKIKRR